MNSSLIQKSTFNWKENYKHNNLKWLKDRTIFLTIHGSWSYGTNIEGSDIDYRGIAIPPKEYFFGINNIFEQALQNEPDITIFDIRKAFKLALDANPNVLEIFFAEPEFYQITTPAFEKILENRDMFLSKKAKFSLSGYAFSQFKRINLHRNYLLFPPDHQPTRKEFKLHDSSSIPKDQLDAARASIQKRMDEWSWKDLEHVEPVTRQALKDLFMERLVEITQWSEDLYEEKLWNCAVNSLGFNTNFIEYLDKERLYINKKKEWNQYQEWKRNRNPKRAEMEAKFQMDCKHASHLIRLIRTCKDLLTTGKYIVKRPDAEELKDIRNGAWTYDQLREWFEKEIPQLDELYKESKLPHQPDRIKADKLLIDIIEESF